MTSIVLFQITLPAVGRFEGGVVFDANPPFYLLSAAARVQVSSDIAAQIGRAAQIIEWRLRRAADRGEPPRAGPVFDKTDLYLGIEVLQTTNDDAVIFEFAGSPRVRLPGDDAAELLGALQRFGDYAPAASSGLAAVPTADRVIPFWEDWK